MNRTPDGLSNPETRRSGRFARELWLASLMLLGVLSFLVWIVPGASTARSAQPYPTPLASPTAFLPYLESQGLAADRAAAPAAAAATPAESSGSGNEDSDNLLNWKWIITTLVSLAGILLGVWKIVDNKFSNLEKMIIESSKQVSEATKMAAEAKGRSEAAQEFSRSARSKAEDADHRAESAHNLAEGAQRAAHKRARRLKILEKRVYDLDQRAQALIRPVMRQRAADEVSFDDLYQALEDGEITREELIEEQQLLAWRKWIDRGEAIGYEELLASAHQDGGLTAPLHYLVREELLRLKELSREKGGLKAELQKRREALVELLKK